MANNVSGNPWILDTAGAALVWPAKVFVEHFEFVDYAGDTDNCELKDASGRSIWKNNGAADLQEVRSGKIGWVSGVALTTVTGTGKVRVYIK
jgi:hypothetical protein